MAQQTSGDTVVVERHPTTAQLHEETAQLREKREGDNTRRAARRRPRPARFRRRMLSMLIVVGVVAAGLAVRGVLPHPADVVSALHTATVGWLVLAAVAEALSMSMFARKERRLLGAFGVAISVPRAEAVTYAGSALSTSMPAGAVVSAGFAYRQYQSRGATHRVAASVMVLSGVLSVAGLAILFGAVTAAGPALAHPGIAISATAAMAGAGWASVHHLSNRRRKIRSTAGPPPSPGYRRSLMWLAARWPWAGRVGTSVADAADVAGPVRRRDWAAALAFSVGNWMGDLACLIAVAYAFGLTLTVAQVAGAYVAVQIVRQIPITPGGIGLIEASLLVALVAAGAPHIAAAAVVLVYRVLSCWLIVPAGLLAWVALQATRPRTDHDRPVTEGT